MERINLNFEKKSKNKIFFLLPIYSESHFCHDWMSLNNDCHFRWSLFRPLFSPKMWINFPSIQQNTNKTFFLFEMNGSIFMLLVYDLLFVLTSTFISCSWHDEWPSQHPGIFLWPTNSMSYKWSYWNHWRYTIQRAAIEFRLKRFNFRYLNIPSKFMFWLIDNV